MSGNAVKLVEITARGPADKKDEAAAFLIEAGSPGVVELNVALPETILLSHTSDTVLPPEGRDASGYAALKAYLKPDAPLFVLSRRLKGIGWVFSAAVYKDLDWVKKSRAAIKPVRVSSSKRSSKIPSILIRPTWSKARKRPGEVLIILDPGMAFGTGSHFTTKTCIKALLDAMDKDIANHGNISFLDVGTGTGVLAIAAKKLGARKAVGVDVDPIAVRVAKANAKRNRVKITASAVPVEDVLGQFNVVAANILAGALKRLAPVIAAKTELGGFLILSGLLRAEAREVSSVYERLGFKPFSGYSDDEWTTLLMRK